MKMRLTLMAGLLAAPLLGIAAGPAGTQPSTQQGSQAVTQAKRLTEADRKVTAGRILLKWGGYVEQVNGQNRRAWAASLWPSLASADLDNLQKASRAVTYEGMRNALLGQRPHDDQIIDSLARSNTKIGTSGNPVTKALGNLAADLVFTPVTPCRIVDTRNIGGRIGAGATRDLNASNAGGNFSLQGGSDTDCGIPANPAALALSVTGLSNLTTGYLRVYPFDGTSAQGSPVPIPAVNTTVTNDMIVPACQGCTQELKVFSTANTHYAAFVTGYFMAPVATALDCQTTGFSALVTLSTSNRNGWAYAPVCAVGFTPVRVVTNASGDFYNLSMVVTSESQAFYHYSGATNAAFAVARRCCRVPGR